MDITTTTDPAYRVGLEQLAGVRIDEQHRPRIWELAELLADDGDTHVVRTRELLYAAGIVDAIAA
jgi:ppGpp synthetase/RelA/SpoT-type nucleotidyltranferase